MSRNACRFSYEIVTSNGCGIHAKGIGLLNEALRRMERIAAAWSIPGEVFEIQQVCERGHGRRYWMREGSRWVSWDAHRDASERKPDWCAVSDGRG